MATILGKSGVNKELKPMYLGNSGVNKQIYTKHLLNMDTVAQTSSYIKFNNSPFTTYNKIRVWLTPDGMQCNVNGAVGFSFTMYDSNYTWNSRIDFNMGYSGYYSSYTFTLTYNGVQVLYNLGYFSPYIFELIFNNTGMSFYLNGTLEATKTYTELNCTGRVPIYGYNTSRTTGSNYMDGTIKNLLIE